MKAILRLCVGAAVAVTGWSSAQACDPIYGWTYRMSDATYHTEMNGAFMRRTADRDTYSGSGTFRDWLVEGENTFTVTLDSGEAELALRRGCEGQFWDEAEVLVEAKFSGPAVKDFTFFAENAPEMPFAKKKLSRDGLPKAIERLQKAANERDFERIWRLLEGMRIRAEAEGFPVEQFKAFTQTIVEGGEVSTRTDLELKPILGGRVWQVMTADYDAPVTIKYKEDGGSTTMRPGRFWSKIKGKWRIVAD